MSDELFCPLPAKKLQYHDKQLDLSYPQVMGILNITPDSFSDGGQFYQPASAVARACQMAQEGASIIDIGAESTRPNATAIDSTTELARLAQVVTAVRQALPDIWISIDTSKPDVMAHMAALGADMWNDVRGLQTDAAADMAAQLAMPVVIMHSRGEPDTMDLLADYDDPLQQIKAELDERIWHALNAGVLAHNIIIDVGMGFAKNHAHHLALMTQLHSLIGEYPMLFGVSRKRFLGEILHSLPLARTKQHSPNARDDIGMAAALLAVQQGASIIRTHHVAGTVDALALWHALCQHHQYQA